MTRNALNLIRGFGSIIDLMPAPRGRGRLVAATPADDAKALYGDWQRVGQHLANAMRRVDAEVAEHGQGKTAAAEPKAARNPGVGKA